MLPSDSWNFSSSGVGKSPEDGSLVRHPWELTLREFLEKVHRDYGIEIELSHASVAGGRFLTKNDRLYPVPVFDEDEVMPIELLKFLCKLYRIPPEDFGLTSEEEDE